MRKVAFSLAVAALLALFASGAALTYPTPGMDVFKGLQNGPLQILSVSEVGVGSGLIRMKDWTTANPSDFFKTEYTDGGWANLYWKQPDLHMVQLQGSTSVTFDGFGVCIDLIHYINPGTEYHAYGVYDFDASNLPRTVKSEAAWKKLTYMWGQTISNSSDFVTSDLDRTALQLATWKGCADDWTTNWTTGEVQVSGMSTTLANRANFYLGLAADNGAYLDMFRVVHNSETINPNQTFAVAVPEPGTILAALAVLSPVGLVFRRRRV